MSNQPHLNENNLLDKISRAYEIFKNQNHKQYLNLLKWISRLVNHAIAESRYKGKAVKYWAFPRGSVVKVDFGYNVGYEIGGVHYAIVLTSKDSTKSGLLTVVPLVSKKQGKRIQPQEIDLGTEFYDTIEHKVEATLRSINIYGLHRSNIETELERFKATHQDKEFVFDEESTRMYPTLYTMLVPDISYPFKATHKYLSKRYEEQGDFYKYSVNSYIALQEEIQFMKSGTVAKIDQITTICKTRIINPTKKIHALNKIKLSDATLDVITKKVNELFLFDKGTRV